MPSNAKPNLIAVDIGNSRMKIGRFEPPAGTRIGLPEPVDSFDLPIIDRSGQFDAVRLRAWCAEHVPDDTNWSVASVHRGAATRLSMTLHEWSKRTGRDCQQRQLTNRDVPLFIRVDEPGRVGIDRLLAAVAANRLRRPDRAAIVVDLGTAITVDLIDVEGAFTGGAILPGIAMSARALEEQTDALPLVKLDRLEHPPAPLGTSTVAAIQSGLYWGAVGAIRELAVRFAVGFAAPPDMFLTGGASPQVAELLTDGTNWPVRHVPHLVLSGIALVYWEQGSEAMDQESQN
jgi:type III pantothenate kinase